MCTTLEGPRDAGNHEKRRADISDSKTRVVDPRHALVYYRREYCALRNEICRLACRCLEGGPLRPYGRVCWSGGLHACQRRKPHQSPSKLVSQRAPSQQPVKPTNQPAQPLQHIPQTQPLRAQCSSRGIILYQNPHQNPRQNLARRARQKLDCETEKGIQQISTTWRGENDFITHSFRNP